MASACTPPDSSAGERRIDHAVAFEPALPAEGFGYDIESEMGLAAGAMSGMAGMLMRFVLDAQAHWSESLAQLFRDHILRCHGLRSYGRSFSGGMPNRQ